VVIVQKETVDVLKLNIALDETARPKK